MDSVVANNIGCHLPLSLNAPHLYRRYVILHSTSCGSAFSKLSSFIVQPYIHSQQLIMCAGKTGHRLGEHSLSLPTGNFEHLGPLGHHWSAIAFTRSECDTSARNTRKPTKYITNISTKTRATCPEPRTMVETARS